MNVFHASGDHAYILCRTNTQLSKDEYESSIESPIKEQPCHIERKRSPSMGPERYQYHKCPNIERIKVIWETVIIIELNEEEVVAKQIRESFEASNLQVAEDLAGRLPQDVQDNLDREETDEIPEVSEPSPDTGRGEDVPTLRDSVVRAGDSGMDVPADSPELPSSMDTGLVLESNDRP